MEEQKQQRAAKRPFHWMLAFLAAIVVAVIAAMAWYQLKPESPLKPPSAPKPPMHNAPA